MEEEKENMRPPPQQKVADVSTIMMIDTSSKPTKGSSAPKHRKPTMPVVEFNAGIERLNKQDEKLHKLKEKVAKCLKALEEVKPQNYMKLSKFVTEVKRVRLSLLILSRW